MHMCNIPLCGYRSLELGNFNVLCPEGVVQRAVILSKRDKQV